MSVNHICPDCGDLLRELEDVAAHPERCAAIDRGGDDIYLCSTCAKVFGTCAEYNLHPCDDQGRDDTEEDTSELSVVDASVEAKDQFTSVELDDMVRRASVPNLASLFKRAKDAGLIKPGKEYGDSN